MKHIENFVVKFDDGTVNAQASIEAFRAALQKHLAQAEQATAEIAVAVHAVFDERRGERLSKELVVRLALLKAGVATSAWSEQAKLVQQYLSTNPAFSARKGRNGGYVRLVDEQPVAAE